MSELKKHTIEPGILEYLRFMRDMGEPFPAIPHGTMELKSDEVAADVKPAAKPLSPSAQRQPSPGKEAALRDYLATIKNCTNCQLHETRTNFVFGTGSANARIMFIGEAPGHDEDIQGIPFVGRAGKLLDKILAAAGLARGEVYIANILKCRPPQNRDPLPAEEQACLPYLIEQIEIIKPAVICCLGRIAAQVLLKTKEPMTNMRGNIFKYQGIPMIVTYHPAAILRNDNLKKPTWEDFQFLLKIAADTHADAA